MPYFVIILKLYIKFLNLFLDKNAYFRGIWSPFRIVKSCIAKILGSNMAIANMFIMELLDSLYLEVSENDI